MSPDGGILIALQKQPKPSTPDARRLGRCPAPSSGEGGGTAAKLASLKRGRLYHRAALRARRAFVARANQGKLTTLRVSAVRQVFRPASEPPEL